jgi:uncharacterized paraquat-inducible protein A
MPGTVKLKGAGWECPECGGGNDVLYVQCIECDIEFEVVGVDARQQSQTTCNQCRYFINDKKAYSEKCYECKRYYGDLFTKIK